jgi:8-oxo-dGTP pyrophosphatase MutT (NUDIX family)
MQLFPDILVKLAKSETMRQLIEAKQLSDKNDYDGKNKILGKLMGKYPKQFKVDSITNGKYVGLTHKPSGFRIHAPRTLVPIGVESYMTDKKAQQQRVRVVIPYKGQYLLERLNNPAWAENLGKIRHIGGGIEAGETPIQAAARELQEEIGANVNPKSFRHLGFHDGQHYLELTDHDIHPGSYVSSVGSDPVITLEHTMPHGPHYIGPDMKKLFKK